MNNSDIEYRLVKSDGLFGILKDPHDHKQHPNQQDGLDLYVSLVNFTTGERCHKKLYRNGKGLHFKHTGTGGNGTHYLSSFTKEAIYIPFQILEQTPAKGSDDASS